MGRSRNKPLEIDPLEAEEARIATGERRRVFYHPGFGCNGVSVGAGQFQPHAAPKGWEFDVDAWVAAGSDGSAPLKRSLPQAIFAQPDPEPIPLPDPAPVPDPVPDLDPEPDQEAQDGELPGQ